MMAHPSKEPIPRRATLSTRLGLGFAFGFGLELGFVLWGQGWVTVSIRDFSITIWNRDNDNASGDLVHTLGFTHMRAGEVYARTHAHMHTRTHTRTHARARAHNDTLKTVITYMPYLSIC